MVPAQTPELVTRKLRAFEDIQAEFVDCFRFKQDVHGQKRFPAFSVEQVVYYLHALWLCECKDRLLGVYENSSRYEGEWCLELLRTWQEGRSAAVVAFLLAKLDMLSLADLTGQIEEARYQRNDEILAHRLEHGRLVALNRGMNLLFALEAIATGSEEDLRSELYLACERYGHTPVLIVEQQAALATPLYAYRPHPLLARRNMTLMNRLDADTLTQTGENQDRSWLLKVLNKPLAPLAEQVIPGYTPLLAPMYNNVRGVRFVDRAEPEQRFL